MATTSKLVKERAEIKQAKKERNILPKFMPKRDGPYLMIMQRSPASYELQVWTISQNLLEMTMFQH